jgi:hypothetical protein
MARSGVETNSDSDRSTLSYEDWPRIKFDEMEYRVRMEFRLKLLVLSIVTMTGLVVIISAIFLLFYSSTHNINTTIIFFLVGSGVFLDVLCVATLFRFTTPDIAPSPPQNISSASQYFDKLHS